MQYLAAHYWQEESKNSSSLVLQQVYHKPKGIPLLLACLCMEENGEEGGTACVQGLTDWFYGRALELCNRGRKRELHRLADSLEEYLVKRVMRSQRHGEISVSGILCVGDSVLLFRRGELKIYVLNQRNDRFQCRDFLPGTGGRDQLFFQKGTIQRGVGILLATEGFCSVIPRDRMEECLKINELRTQECLDGRLRELGRTGEQQGGKNMGAILLVNL